MKKFAFVFLAVVLLMSLSAFSQSTCVNVRGIAQIHLLDFGNPDWEGGRPGDVWVGPVQFAAGKEAFVGKMSENDGTLDLPSHTGQGRGDLYLDFGADGSLLLRYSHAAWPNFPNYGPAVGTFHGQGSIDVANGTGRFVKTTGNLTFDGPFLVWNLDQPLPSGRFNASITGTLCNIAPK